MTRGNARELAMHLIYSRNFTGEDPREAIRARTEQEYYANLAGENEVYADMPTRKQVKYLDQVVSGVMEEEDALNEIIAKYAIGWDISRISRLSRAIMQLAIYEIIHFEDVPDNVAVSEAVRLTKLYDTDSAAFVNGILGSFVRARKAGAEAPAEENPAAESAAETEEVSYECNRL